MIINADLHIHGRYSRATSKNLDFANLEKYAKQKGLSLLGTGDFTHPKWISEIKTNLTEKNGILYTKTNFPFLLQTEISLIYRDKVLNEGKRIHILILAPSIEVVEQINAKLLTFGRLDYDGRPIFKIQPDDFIMHMREISEDIEVIPAHIWTPWFALFGSESGYNSVKDCFKDQTKYVHAMETGLSSDPMMNWQVSELDKYNLISSSDSHSFWPWRIGRESTLFNVHELNYKNIIAALRSKNKTNTNRIEATIEFWPEEGKYHYDGHRKCNFSCNPDKTVSLNSICPNCNKELTVGVAYRVKQIADRNYGTIPKDATPFVNLIPLAELVAFALKSTTSGKKTIEIYNKFINHYGNEYNVLLLASKDDLLTFAGKNTINPIIIKTILDNRDYNVFFKPGYDGEYGVISELNSEMLKSKDEYYDIKIDYLRKADKHLREEVFAQFSKDNLNNNAKKSSSLSKFI